MPLLPSLTRGSGPVLTGRDLYLRHPDPQDYDAWAMVREESRDHLMPWEPTWAVDEHSRAAFRRRLQRHAREIREDQAYPFFVFAKADGALLGGVTVSNVRRGVAQAASIGYWIGVRFKGQGVMTQAVAVLVPHLHGALGMHRIEAACIPDNGASKRVLLKNGFREEGLARSYLKIAGTWRDHALFGRVAGDPLGPA